MKCMILCADNVVSFAPLEDHIPKALLEIEQGKSLLHYIVEKVNELDEIDEIYLVTNDRFFGVLKNWATKLNNQKPIEVINDHIMNDDERLGAIGDIGYALNFKNVYDDILIILGDNLFDFQLRKAVDFFYDKQAPVVGGQYEFDSEMLTKLGVIEIDEWNKIIRFEEKPHVPKGTIKSLGIYIYPKHVISILKQYLEEGNRIEAPGYFLDYLYQREPVYVFPFEGNWFDVGTWEALQEVRNFYRQ